MDILTLDDLLIWRAVWLAPDQLFEVSDNEILELLEYAGEECQPVFGACGHA